jgi:hypothetical protein
VPPLAVSESKLLAAGVLHVQPCVSAWHHCYLHAAYLLLPLLLLLLVVEVVVALVPLLLDLTETQDVLLHPYCLLLVASELSVKPMGALNQWLGLEQQLLPLDSCAWPWPRTAVLH